MTKLEMVLSKDKVCGVVNPDQSNEHSVDYCCGYGEGHDGLHSWEAPTKTAYLSLVKPPRRRSSKSSEFIIRKMLQHIGEDPNREGLKETPTRVTKAWQTWFGGYGQDPKAILKAFSDGAESCDQLVFIRGIPTWSMCEHHLAPFFGQTSIGYIPDKKIVGLSKFTRLVDIFARRLQVQERLTNQIADAIQDCLQPKGVGVVIECRHTCMESRGVKTSGTITSTSALRGCILKEDAARLEFLSMVHNKT